MKNDYSLNNDQGEANWFQKTRIYKVITNPIIFVCIILFICIVVVIYWNYIRPRQFKTIYKKFAGFKYAHLTKQEIKESRIDMGLGLPKDAHSNSQFTIYGSSGSGKASFLKHYLGPYTTQQQVKYLVFGRDEREFPSQNFVPLLQLGNVSIEQLANKIVVLDDAGAYKSLKTKVEDLFRFGRHHGIQVIYLAHYAKDVLPIVRENCHKIFLTINNPDNFFESIVQTYSIKDGLTHSVLKYYRDQLVYGIIEFDTRSQKYKVLNHRYNLTYDSGKRKKWGPEDNVANESYCFTGDEYNKLKVILEEMSDQTIEVTPYKIAF